MGNRGTFVAVVLAAIAVGTAVVLFYQQPGAEPAPKTEPPRTGAQTAPAPRPVVVRPPPLPVATARIAAVEGASAQGSIRLISREAGGVAIDYRLENLPPGEHALAVRRASECPLAEGASSDDEIGRVVANVMGRTRGKLVAEGLTLGLGGDGDVMGRALVVHESGLGGRVLGCGVIGSP